MDVERAAEELTERKVVRRGLLAGIAALSAAAAVKLTGASKAEAHDVQDVLLGGPNIGVGATTSITATVSANAGFKVINGGSDVSGKSGIVGVTDAAGGGGVRGYNDTAGGFGVGGDSVGGIGVLGTSTGTTAGISGVQGAGAGPLTFGVRGVNSANGVGVRGVSNASGTINQGDGSGTGVDGRSGSGNGVMGSTVSAIGVLGNALNTAVSGVEGRAGPGTTQGIRGVHFNNGTGIKGVSNASLIANDGDGSGTGVHGKSGSGPGVKGESSSGAGVYGSSVSQPGVDGTSTNSLGIRGTSTNFVGIVGISTNSHGLYGSSASPGNYGIIAENTTPGGGPGLYVTGSAFINGSLQVTGAKNAVIKMQDGSDGLVYCQEAPEPYFEDFGRDHLTGGVATVQLEREFAALVAGTDYMVFLTPEGPGWLYVSRRGPASFEVREGNGGTGNLSFTYRVVTKRKDIEGKRFERVNPEHRQKVAATRAAIAAGGHIGGPSGPGPR